MPEGREDMRGGGILPTGGGLLWEKEKTSVKIIPALDKSLC